MTEAVKDIVKKEDTEVVASEVRAEAMARFDVIVKDKHIEVLADMPGVTKDTVDITIHQNVLEITGKRTDYDGMTRLDHKCSFTLGEQVSRDGITATVNNGVLKLAIPKAKDHGVKKIKVKT